MIIILFLISGLLVGSFINVCIYRIPLQKSIEYPLIELLNGILYGGIAFKYGLSIISVIYCITISILIAVSVIDFKYMIIPDSLNIALGAVGLILILIERAVIGDRFLGASVGFALFLAIDLVSKALGGGDIKLITALGLIYGLKGVFFIIFFSFIIGAVFSTILLILKIKSKKDEIPFGPFISAATILYIFAGTELIHIYFSFI